MVIAPDGPTMVSGNVPGRLVWIADAIRVSSAPAPNSTAGGASQMVISRLSPTPTIVPTG
jgi:hypothetical protein